MTQISLLQSIAGLLAGIIVIVVLTARFKVHAFFALLLACVVTSAILRLPVTDIISVVKTGFGNIVGSLGLLIILGTTLGLVLEHTGSTAVLAALVLKKTGAGRSSLAMNIIGYIVGMPIFCDSGFIVLSGLNKALARRSRISLLVMASSLAAGLYAVHCMMPPHPGITAATGAIHADLGRVMLYGLLIAIPAAFCGYCWSVYAGSKLPAPEIETEESDVSNGQQPSALMSVLPVAVPIFLIALRSMLTLENTASSAAIRIISTLGIPEVALSVGILLALAAKKNWERHSIGSLLEESAIKAAGILVIIGGGGAFGAILAKADIGSHFAQNATLTGLGLFVPFLITTILKTAQGSSTVAVITAATIVQPLLPTLGLDHENGRIISVLAMGAGSMMISHTNDAYFWVIARFSGLEIRDMLRVYSTGTIVMGIVAIASVYGLSLLIL
ncbi:MAG TPA: GntP family permease [Chitinophaga sp.]|uniref:GntP family permease n=1 Tax=Chitinophaga sp. TaxID=1869181 RepID=UPI002CAF218E|nr:GntP family permease [Chitinophaga sp.]HVI47728.1 GntP family permease [Chitinophaga sp.]